MAIFYIHHVFEVLIAYISLLQWQPGVAKIFIQNDFII